MNPSPAGPEALVRPSDLAAASRLVGTSFRVVGPDVDSGAAVLEGDYRLVSLRRGLVLHATDTHDLHDLTTEVVQQPGITCALFLEGSVEMSIGGKAFALAAGKREPLGLLVARARPDLFVRRSRRGAHIRKVNVTFDPEWLDGEAAEHVGTRSPVADFARTHLASLRWTPSARLVSLAEQILRPPAYLPALQRLYLESRAIEIATEALLALARSPGQPCGANLRPREFRRAEQIRAFVEDRLDQPFTLSQIARDVGINASAVQRIFLSVHGTTVFKYVRRRRLERARDLLEREGLTVSEAAYVAGYVSPANFATAFKRAFGVSPSQIRTRL